MKSSGWRSTRRTKRCRTGRLCTNGYQDAPVAQDTLPDEPLFSITPQRGWVGLNLRELWAYRELLYFLTWRDIKVRYKQTVLGVAWAILQPVVSMMVFTLFFGKLAHMPSDGIPYPIFAYAGLLPWTFVSNAVSGAGDSLVGSAALVTKVYFPRLVIPCAAVCAALVDFAIASVILFAMMLWYGMALPWQMLMLAPLAAIAGLARRGRGDVDVGAQREVSRRALCAAVPDPGVDVRHPDHLSGEHRAGEMALAARLESSDRRDRRFPERPVRAGFPLGRPRSGGGDYADVLVYSAYAFRRMERQFADIV